MKTVGILHPGSMGSSVGAALREAGQSVIWSSTGRSEATRRRAHSDGLIDAGTVAHIATEAEVVFSICPPEAAVDVGRQLLNAGFKGTFVDANAVSPATAASIAEAARARGVVYVDGGIIGPPARAPGTTRLYLSGGGASAIAALFEGSLVAAIALEGPPEAASALKMAYAGWTKGTTALLAATVAVAEREQVWDALAAEWQRLGLLPRVDGLGHAAARAWRWAGEMEEIAATFGAAGLPSGFHEAAADVFRRMAIFKDDLDAPGGTELAKTLLPDV